MNSHLRRIAIVLAHGVLALACLVLLVPAAQAQSTPGVRMKLEDFVSGPAGAKRLASLEKAIAKMKSLDNSTNPQDFRRSWAYWANIHGYYGPTSPDGTVAQQIQYLQQNNFGQYVKYYNGINDQTPPDNVAKTTWATCQHSGDQQAQNFFLWHRMYLYYFEKVLQWASGDPTLRLPYWNYTDPRQEQIPAAFRNVRSVLYDARRDPGMNAGTSQLSPQSTNIDRALQNSNYLSYESTIERGIHGYVHCTVGPTCPVANMGDVPVAGNDPVFYTHHANIDRLFACWETRYGIPSGSWSTQTFSFPDANGNLVTKPVSDFLDTKKLGYVYDNESACTRTPLTLAAVAAAPSGAQAVLARSQGIAINRPKVTVDITLSAPARHTLKGLGAVQAPPVYLKLRDITAQAPPGVLLDVYIFKKSNPENKQYVGTISWFNDFGVGHHHRKPLDKTEDFNISNQLRKLGAATAEEVTVSIETTTGRVPAGAAQGLRGAPPALNPAANVKIGTIEIHEGK